MLLLTVKRDQIKINYTIRPLFSVTVSNGSVLSDLTETVTACRKLISRTCKYLYFFNEIFLSQLIFANHGKYSQL